MDKHPKAGKVVEVTSGPLKGKFIVVIDYLVNQFQGKAIKNIAKAHPELVRGIDAKLVDEKLVYAYVYPSKENITVHDSELLVEEEKPVVSKSEKKRLAVVKGGKDDSRGSSEGDNQDAGTGESESDGRSVSGGEELTEVESPFTDYPESTESDGSGAGGREEESHGDNKPKAKPRAKGKGAGRKATKK